MIVLILNYGIWSHFEAHSFNLMTYLIKKLATLDTESDSFGSQQVPSECDSAPWAGLKHERLGVSGTGTAKVIDAPVGNVTVSVSVDGDTKID